MRTKLYPALMLALLAVAAPLAVRADEDATPEITAEKVRAVLLEKGGHKAIPIAVTMDRTTCILTGDVESAVVQELAQEVALSVEGVKKVDNRLRVKGAPSMSQMTPEQSGEHNAQELADAKLESSVKLALWKAIGTGARRLEVEAVQGVVSVRGPVADEERKKVALKTVGELQGVKSVVDLIKVGG
jgi:osmotically-inducible protein OsmY